MLKKNDVVTITITGMGADGEGVGHAEGMAVFVPFVLLGEQVEVLLVKVQKQYAFGKLLRVLKPSPHRAEPKCPLFQKCGGCSLWHMDAEAEQAYKTQKVRDCLERIGGLTCQVNETIMPENLEGYRNKALYPVTTAGIGFYAPRSHRLVPLSHCKIQHPCNRTIVEAVQGWMERCAIEGYDEATHAGCVRGLFVRVGAGTGEIMVCLITATPVLPCERELVDDLLAAQPGIVSILHNINSERTNVMLGERARLLHGAWYITDRLGELSFRISLHSFYQVNSEQTKVLYDLVADYAQLTGRERVLDLYGGIGTIGLWLAGRAKEVIGVECVPQAVDNARDNARLNGIQNAAFRVGTAEALAPALGHADVIVIDPPRKGCDGKLLETLARLAPQRIVYVSCNPATLARDLKVLAQKGYQVQRVQPVNMFPRTAHVECVVLLER